MAATESDNIMTGVNNNDNNNKEGFVKKACFYTDINKNRANGTSSYSPESKIYKLHDYYFVREGDFDIVWLNVYIFVIGHMLWAAGLYNLVTQQLLKTWVYCKFRLY